MAELELINDRALIFTSDDRIRLALFCEICDSIGTCRFVREFYKQSHHISVGTLPDGRVVDEYPRYDDDDLRAFFTHYRKLRLEQDPTNLFAIMKLLKWKGNELDREQLDAFKNNIKEEERSWWGATLIDQNGEKKFLSQEDLEDVILNGEVFHSDAKKTTALRRLIAKASVPKALAFYNYLRFAMTVMEYAQRTAALIRQRGYLEQQPCEETSSHRGGTASHPRAPCQTIRLRSATDVPALKQKQATSNRKVVSRIKEVLDYLAGEDFIASWEKLAAKV
jgi:hypothetical protein